MIRAQSDNDNRLTDNNYLARIIFSEMIKHDVLGTTGYGISTEIGDNEHPILFVDPNEQTIYLVNEEDVLNRKTPVLEKAIKTFSFDEFLRDEDTENIWLNLEEHFLEAKL